MNTDAKRHAIKTGKDGISQEQMFFLYFDGAFVSRYPTRDGAESRAADIAAGLRSGGVFVVLADASFERGRSKKIHASRTATGKALCGLRIASRKGQWYPPFADQRAINCKRCLAALKNS